MSTSTRSSGALRLLTAGIACAAVLTGCGGGDESEDRPDRGDKAADASAEKAEDVDLASGLLGDEAFGPDAVVTSLSDRDLERGAGLAAEFGDLEVSPESCAVAVDQTQPDISDFDDVAAVSAEVGSTVTLQMLTRGGPIEDAVEQLAGAAVRCPEAQISSPEIGQATVRFTDLPVAELGDGSAALAYTTVVTLPDGTEASVPALLGAVRDGDRLVILTTLSVDPTGAGAPLDQAAFTSLLEQAYEAQDAALD